MAVGHMPIKKIIITFHFSTFRFDQHHFNGSLFYSQMQDQSHSELIHISSQGTIFYHQYYQCII